MSDSEADDWLDDLEDLDDIEGVIDDNDDDDDDSDHSIFIDVSKLTRLSLLLCCDRCSRESSGAFTDDTRRFQNHSRTSIFV